MRLRPFTSEPNYSFSPADPSPANKENLAQLTTSARASIKRGPSLHIQDSRATEIFLNGCRVSNLTPGLRTFPTLFELNSRPRREEICNKRRLS